MLIRRNQRNSGRLGTKDKEVVPNGIFGWFGFVSIGRRVDFIDQILALSSI